MKMKLNLFVMAAAAGLALSSCKKDNELPDTFDADQLVAVDQNQTDNEAEEVTALEDQVMAANESIINGRIAADTIVVPVDSSNCAKVTIIPKGSNPTGKMIMDFGTGCLCKDGRTRKGKIISVFTDRLRKQGAVIETSYDGFGIIKRGSSDYLMFDNSSTKKTTTKTAPAVISDGAVLEITREVDMKMTMPDGQTFSHKGTRDMKWELKVLENKFDNVYTTRAGSSQSGIDRKGRNYTMTVDVDVVRKTECYLQGYYKPVSGQITLQHDSKTKVVNFGDGTSCDDDVDVTISGRKRKMRW